MSPESSPPKEHGLIRALGIPALTANIVNTTIGAGIFVLPALVATGLGAAAPLELGSRLYQSIGVRPILNARGTFTIITGSQTLPEVKRAMEEASRHYVQMDELMELAAKGIRELIAAQKSTLGL